MQLDLFSNIDNKTIVSHVREQLQALQVQGITITDRVIKMTVMDSVKKHCPELLFLPRLRLVDEIYESEEWK